MRSSSLVSHNGGWQAVELDLIVPEWIISRKNARLPQDWECFIKSLCAYSGDRQLVQWLRPEAGLSWEMVPPLAWIDQNVKIANISVVQVLGK